MIDFLKIKAISFDLDDTLWPVWPTIGRAEEALVLADQSQAGLPRQEGGGAKRRG
jgi:FMN phosphatase YigB (HAD superfamily)